MFSFYNLAGHSVTEQCFWDQARIRTNEWITKMKLENIRTYFKKEKYIEVDNHGITGEWFYQNEENIHKNKATHVDTETFGKEKAIIQNILDLIKDNSGIELRGFNKADRCVLAEWSRKRNHIIKHFRTENVTDTNILIKAVIIYVGKN